MRRRRLERRRPIRARPEDLPATRERIPARRIIYRSRAVRLARAAAAAVLGALTIWLARPVLESQAPPPRTAGLYLGLNTLNKSPSRRPESSLSVAIRANGCTNPVSVEGFFNRPARSWTIDQQASEKQNGVKGPTEAEIVLSGAKVSQIRAGFAEGEPLEGAFESSTLDEGVLLGPRAEEEFFHNRLKKFLNVRAPKGKPAIGAAILKAPAWPYVKAPVHFFIDADLMHPDGYHRCYVDVPALFGSGGGVENRAFREAFAFTIRPTPEYPVAPHEVVEVPGYPDIDELNKAEVTVLVSGHTVDGRSVGSGATTIPNGVRYSCMSAAANPPAKTNVTCAGTPVFEVPGTESVTTRDLFFAGISGALAATLLLEALIGETEPRRRND